MRYRLIGVALKALATTGVARILTAPPDACGVVATLHHVRPDPPVPFLANAGLSITPNFLAAFLTTARENGWIFTDLDEIVKAEAEKKPGRRMAMTLDDGFRDNAEHALPVFRRLGVPFTVFVCPGFCDAQAELWWEALERIVAAHDVIRGEGVAPGGRLPAGTKAQKLTAFRRLERWLVTELDEDEQRSAIRDLAARHGVDMAQVARDLVMGWDEVRAMAAEPLCTIGAHTMSHPALARLPAERALAEMRGSAERIERELGHRPWAIAFPYGTAAAAGRREARLAAEAGFTASFTTRPGYVAAGGGAHGLPRVSLNGLFQDPVLAQPLLEPALWRLRERLARVSARSAPAADSGPAAAST